MTVNLSALAGAGQQFFDNNGNPLSGGKLYTYAAGTTTPQATYTSITGLTAHTNPIILDSAGRVPSGGEIWITNAVLYKFVLKTSAEVTIGTYDNISAINGNVNANNVIYNPPFTGAVATTVGVKLATFPTLMDFGAVGNGVTNDSSAIAAALNSGAPCVSIPAGKVCLFSQNITIPSGVTLIGPGALKASSTSVTLVLSNDNSVIDGVEFIGGVQDTLYSVAINGLTSSFSNASLVTGGGALSTVGGVAGNDLTLGFVTDSGSTVTEVFSSLIAISSSKRYVVQIEEGFVKSGYVAGEMKIRAFDSSGTPIVGNSSITVDASGYYEYILPTTFADGNYLFLENASFVQFSFAVQRDANQQAGNTVVYDMTKVKFLELINYLATSPKTSLDNAYVVTITGTNSVVKNCYFRNLANASIGEVNSQGSLIVNNTFYNCLSAINVNTTNGTTIAGNKIIADFGGYGNRAYRWKAIGGINNTNLTVDSNTAKGNHWGFEVIENTGLSYKGCSFTNNHVDSISTALSLAGYDGAVISGNTCITRDLSNYVLEVPQININCEISNNTLTANTEMTQSFGISGVGGRNPANNTRIVNNRIKATIGITCIFQSPATANSNFNVTIANNAIEYGSTAIFCNFGDIRFENNTAFTINKGSNQIFGRRAGLQINGSGFTYTSYVRQNMINVKDCYSIFGESTRLLDIQDNSIVQTNAACPPIYYNNFAFAATQPTVVNNNITTAYSGKYIEFIGTPFAGSLYNIYKNTGGTAKINVDNLPLSSALINVSTDPLIYSGTVTPSAGTFSKTVDVVKQGNYWLSTTVHNGDFNHTQFAFQKQVRSVGTVNTLQVLTNIQSGSCGSLITALTVDTSTGSIVFSGTNSGSLNGSAIPYTVVMNSAET
jgi:hypothetical protein